MNESHEPKISISAPNEPNVFSKRDIFAAMAMQGISSSFTVSREVMAEFTATVAVKYADALISELNKPKEKE